MHNFKIGTISNGWRYLCKQHLSCGIHFQQYAGADEHHQCGGENVTGS